MIGVTINALFGYGTTSTTIVAYRQISRDNHIYQMVLYTEYSPSLALSIDIMDYVNEIGNCSREQ